MVNIKKSQPEAMQGFEQLAKAAMTSGAISEKYNWLGLARFVMRQIVLQDLLSYSMISWWTYLCYQGHKEF